LRHGSGNAVAGSKGFRFLNAEGFGTILAVQPGNVNCF